MYVHAHLRTNVYKKNNKLKNTHTHTTFSLVNPPHPLYILVFRMSILTTYSSGRIHVVIHTTHDEKGALDRKDGSLEKIGKTLNDVMITKIHSIALASSYFTDSHLPSR